jgi:mannitol-1-phosphate 5-dehydrogenase
VRRTADLEEQVCATHPRLLDCREKEEGGSKLTIQNSPSPQPPAPSPLRRRTFVGFGFGPIQAGLFLYEAFRSDSFGKLVVAEVAPDTVNAVRRAGGRFSVNIAQSDRTEIAEIGPLEIEDPGSASDRQRLVEAVAEAEEIATAVPSVQFYTSPSPGSIHHLLAQGLRRKAAARGPQAVVYAAENHNHAAETLEARVFEEIPENERARVATRVRFLNTVIGKMSGVVSDADEIRMQGLATITPGGHRAFLVEAFNRILISKIHFAGTGDTPSFQRGMRSFEEKDDLLPFEEAKLHGHNATHALAAYVGALRGVERIADLGKHPDVMAFLRAAFIRESGQAFVRKHAGKDPLFTQEGYREYADDLLARMVNPFLHDSVERVGRDPERKLAWDDRLVGTLRVSLQQGVKPARYAFGTAAALAVLERNTLETDIPLATWLLPLWRMASPNKQEEEKVLGLVEEGRKRLRRWRAAGFQDLEGLFEELYP